ncbi:uncharacterized protein ACNLHF_024503 isoform 1-T1 [Anomaloglossus baeobatrachus]
MERSSRMWSGLEKLLPPSTLLTFGINMSFGKESVKAHIYENSSLLHPWLSFVNLKACIHIAVMLYHFTSEVKAYSASEAPVESGMIKYGIACRKRSRPSERLCGEENRTVVFCGTWRER